MNDVFYYLLNIHNIFFQSKKDNKKGIEKKVIHLNLSNRFEALEVEDVDAAEEREKAIKVYKLHLINFLNFCLFKEGKTNHIEISSRKEMNFSAINLSKKCQPESSSILEKDVMNQSITYSADDYINKVKLFTSQSFLKKFNHDVYNFDRLYNLQSIPKRYLKKCKFCAFKKRSCFSCPSSCKAVERTCIACGKVGHYPKSKKCTGWKIRDYKIAQLDGGDDEDTFAHKDSSVIKKMYASNCEIYEVAVISNFLRKCIHFWNVDENHQICGFYVLSI